MAQAAAVLPRLHTLRPGDGHDWYALGIERRIEIKWPQAHARRYTDAFSQIREVQNDADDATVKGLALFRIDRITDAEYAANIEHLNDVARLNRGGDVTGVAEERLPVPECAGDDVALADLRHAAARKFEGVIGGLVVEDLHYHHDPFLGRDIARDAQFARQAACLSHGGNLVDNDAQHAVHEGRQAFRAWRS